jgi:hypothetical protein
MNLSSPTSTSIVKHNTLTHSDLQLVQPAAIDVEPIAITKDWREFDPVAYLNEYYGDLGPENLAILRFYVDVFHEMEPKSTMLDFGSGPTIYSLISAVTKIKEIQIVEYLEANRLEIRKWLTRDNTAFNWLPFIKKTIECEQKGWCSAFDITRREALIRNHVTAISRCDVRQTPPFVGGRQTYDVVASNFCAESITESHSEWKFFLQNVTSLVKPGGTLIMTTLKGAASYSVGSHRFPAVCIDETDLTDAFIEAGLSPASITIRNVPADRPSRYYKGLMLATAVKPTSEPTRRRHYV